MIRINLLPFRAARRKENVRRQISVFLCFLLVTALALIVANMYFSGQVKDLTNQVNGTRTALNAKKQQAAEVDRIQKQLEILDKKTEVITDLKLGRKEAVLLVAALTEMVIEKRMWFTSLEAKASSLNLTGVALDNKTVADFMTRLEETEIFHNVRLRSTKKKSIGTYDNLKSFVVTLEKRPMSVLVKAKEEAKKS